MVDAGVIGLVPARELQDVDLIRPAEEGHPAEAEDLIVDQAQEAVAKARGRSIAGQRRPRPHHRLFLRVEDVRVVVVVAAQAEAAVDD